VSEGLPSAFHRALGKHPSYRVPGGDDSAEGGGRAVEHEGRTTADDAEDRGRKSVEDGPNVPIHTEFCIEYGSSFATATDAILSTSATHNYSCESLDILYCRLNNLT